MKASESETNTCSVTYIPDKIPVCYVAAPSDLVPCHKFLSKIEYLLTRYAVSGCVVIFSL